MRGNRIGTWFMAAGLLMTAAALCLAVTNLRQAAGAGNSASEALHTILEEIRVTTETDPTDPKATEAEPAEELLIPDYIRDPHMEMPTLEHEGQSYIGVLSIPELELELPIISQWSYPRLRIAPCRYQGSAYLDNLILLAHNYQTHFGRLLELGVGDDVFFQDVNGNLFHYCVVELETLGASDVEEMTAGDWDLTLFTCTLGGRTRVTVRCQRTENQ